MYADMKKALVKRRYTSVSELIRSHPYGLYPSKVTVNGFTPEFEEQVLAASIIPERRYRLEWEGVITDFVLKHAKKRSR